MRTTSSDEVLVGGLGQVLRRVALELLEEDAVGGDLAERLAVGRARHRDADRARGAVAGQADHPHVVAEVLAAELGADAELAGELEHLGLQLDVAEGVAARAALAGERVEVAGRGQLGHLHRRLGRRAADDHGEVVGRAGRGAELAELLVEEAEQRRRVEERLGLLEQEALVGRAAALGHEEELVGVAVDRGDLDLGRQVGLGVHLVPHGERRHLGVAQVGLLVGVEHAAGDGRLVAAGGQHVLALLALHDRGAGVLAAGQHAAGGDVGVLEQLEGDEVVVGRCLGVVEDGGQLGEVAGSEEVGDVAHGLAREQGEGLGLDLQEALAGSLEGGDVVRREQPVGGVVRPERQHVVVDELGHSRNGTSRPPSAPQPAETVGRLRRRSGATSSPNGQSRWPTGISPR